MPASVRPVMLADLSHDRLTDSPASLPPQPGAGILAVRLFAGGIDPGRPRI